MEGTARRRSLEDRAEQIRVAVNRPDLSNLRAFDVLLWRWGKSKGLKIKKTSRDSFG